MSGFISQLYEHFKKYKSVVTDSRKITKGSIFFALKGEKYDGNMFVNEALEKGATYVVIDDPSRFIEEKTFLVENTLIALQQFASFHRKQFDIPVLAITGSNGKTTTKELLATVLASTYRTHYTKGNFNNHIGVPLTLLEMDDETEIAIIEMGANHVGEIATLCQIANPTHGIITNIGKAHIGEFGGFEGIIKGKGELFDFLKAKGGLAFINTYESSLQYVEEKIDKKIYINNFNENDKSIYQAKLEKTTPFLEVSFKDDDEQEVYVYSHLYGEYNFNNLLLAVGVGKYFKINSRKIKSAIESYIPSNNRSQLILRESYSILMDAYNANPSSMKNAIIALSQNHNGSKKIAILGDMFELGEFTKPEHEAILEFAIAQKIDQVITIGNAFGQIESDKNVHFKDINSLKEWFDDQFFTDSVILIKGSRSMQLEKLL